MSGPLRAVLAAIDNGARSHDAVAAATGLSRDVVDAAVDHLARTGRVTAQLGCPTLDCAGCGFASMCAAAGRRLMHTR